MEMTMDGQNESLLTEDHTTEHRYAGFWMRFWAYMIDVLIVFSVKGLLLSPLALTNNGEPFEIGYWTLSGVLGAAIFLLYFALMTKFFQQTVGKMIFGLKVISATKEKLSWSDVFFREIVGRFIYNLFAVLKLLYIVVGFTKHKQGLHDYVANTYVIHERN